MPDYSPVIFIGNVSDECLITPDATVRKKTMSPQMLLQPRYKLIKLQADAIFLHLIPSSPTGLSTVALHFQYKFSEDWNPRLPKPDFFLPFKT